MNVLAEFTLPWIPPSQNLKRGWHWSKLSKLHDTACMYVLSAIGRRQPIPEAGRVTVTIQMYRHNLMDDDNSVASCKPIFDALVRLGWARDDASKWMEQRVLPVRIDRKSQRTEIKIERE